jgi:Flp pilus assembly protein TadD
MTNISDRAEAGASDPVLAEYVDQILRAIDELEAQFSMQGLTDRELECIYKIAFGRYSQGRFDLALPLFRGLVVHRPNEVRYLTALAACYEMCRKFDSAANVYEFLLLSDGCDPEIGARHERCLMIAARQRQANPGC